MSNWTMKGEEIKDDELDEDKESSDEESSLSTDEEKFGASSKSIKKEAITQVQLPAAQTGQNGRSEENGSSQQNSDKEARLQNEVELIHRKLIETGDMTKLRAFLMKKLYQGSWKHAVFNLCSAASAKHEQITFQQLYSSVQKEAKELVSEKIKQTMIEEVKKCYYRDKSLAGDAMKDPDVQHF